MGIRVQSWLSFLPALVGLLLCLMSCTGTASANVHWINAAGGNWSDPNNWQDDNGQHRLPTNDAADITLSGAYTVTLDVDDTCQLLLGDGSGGQTLTIPAGRTLTVKSRFSANGATVNNAGTMVFDVVDFQGYLVLDNGATLNNLTGGLLDFRSSRNMEWQGNGAQPKLVNAVGATLRVDDPIPGGAGGAGNLDILTVLLDNSGTLDVEGTSMRLVLGGDSRFTGQLRDGTVITGPSTCIWAGGNLTATGTITINADCHMTGGCVFGGTHTLTGSGALQCQDDSNLSGAGITTTARGFHVYFTHDPVTLTSQTARTVTPRVASSTVNLNGHTINNSGVVTIVSGERLLADNGAVINNLAGGVFGAQGGGLLTWDGHGRNPQLNNQAGGILRQVANVNTGAVSFTLEDIVFTNSGQIDAQGTDTSNNILVLDNVNHGGGRVALNDGTLVTGPGACRLDTSYDTASSLTRTATGTITINGTLRSDTYGSAVGSYGTLAGTFTMEGTGVFQWGGYLIGPGKTTFAPGFHVQTIGGTLAGHTVVNKGTVTPIRNLFLAGTALFNNASGGLLDFASDDPNGDDLDGRNGSAAAPPVLHNLAGGVIRKSGGTNFNTIQDLTTINSGTIEARSGNLWLCGGIYNGSRGSFTQDGGQMLLNGGSLGANSANPIMIQGGVVTGSGWLYSYQSDVTVVNSGGVIRPVPRGAITIRGSYTQNGRGQLDIALGGTAPGTGFSQLLVSGKATMGGTLNLSLINGFRPTSANRFQVMTYNNHSGTFNSVTAPFVAQYGDTGVTVALGHVTPQVPTLTSLSSTSGAVGSTVAINGTNLSGAAVFFNGVQAAVNTAQSTATRVLVTVPAGATTGPVRVVTPNGTVSSSTPFTVVLIISGTVTRGTATIPGVSSTTGPVPRVPVFLLSGNDPTALATGVVDPVLLTGNPALVQRTTNAAGRYVFVVQPGVYTIVPALPGVFFSPTLSTETIGASSALNQNFAGAGTDLTPPSVQLSSASDAGAFGTATDSGSGILTVVVTLQGKGGLYYDWSSLGMTPQFTTRAVLGSYRVVNSFGSNAPLLNTVKVSSQSWNLTLPNNLPKGGYTLTVRAIDRAFHVSAPLVQSVVFGVALDVARSNATNQGVRPSTILLSRATASVATSSIQLRFTGSLDAESASDPQHYSILVNGREVEVESASYDTKTNSVTLALAQKILHSGDRVAGAWRNLRDLSNGNMNGVFGPSVAR